MSAGKTAAIVAATVVPVVLIIVGALFLSRFLWRRETAKSSELAVAPRPQSTVRGGGWASNAGYQRTSHTITTQSHQLSVRTPATSPRSTADSISLRNVPQGVYERHFGDLSFLLDGSEQSDSSDNHGNGDSSSMVDSSRCSSDFLTSRGSAGRQASYYIPSSVLDLASVGQEFAELNERFGLQV
ncbi:hypothetical protein B0J12DRAFT_687137 [Macrophomina phaseolina]|uniref:Uncharacterized protein n=1 Tax=Macrophomina phaseolina TaxID=35725 RepID=A0ABQ8FTI9_9PEZI|nr:hypothetical protein B0J12DRAFT_687137 [Macrophomina phaseolina]